MTARTPTKGFTLIELMIVVAIIGILAAIAIPNFLRFQAKSKQSEPKVNLRALWVAQKSYFADRDTFSSSISDIGFVPERGNRYSIANGGASGTWSNRNAASEDVAGATGVTSDVFKGFSASTVLAITNITTAEYAKSAGTCAPAADIGCILPGNNGAFMALAAANVDNDTTIDTWCVTNMSVTIAPNSTVGSEAEVQNNGPGIPSNNINDVR